MPSSKKKEPPTPSAGQKAGKFQSHDESVTLSEGEQDTVQDLSRTPRPKNQRGRSQSVSKETISASQSTIDKHLVPAETEADVLQTAMTTMKLINSKLDKLASKDFIEEKLKTLVTEKFMTEKIKNLEQEMKNEIKKEIDIIHGVIRQLKDRVQTTETEITELKNKVSDVETTLEITKKENEKIKEENRKLSNQLLEREIKVTKQTEEINNLEQYTRKNSVRIYGMEDKNPKETSMETASQVIKLLNDKLQVKINYADIDMVHRMGRFKNDANRPVICKFISRFAKQDVVRARRKLKGTAIVIREDLTTQNAKLLEKTSAHDNVKSAWSDDGKIIALLKNDRKSVVGLNTDLNRLL